MAIIRFVVGRPVPRRFGGTATGVGIASPSLSPAPTDAAATSTRPGVTTEMTDATDLQADYCPACGAPVRDAWTVPVAAAPKVEFVAALDDGHIELSDAGVRVYHHAEGGDEV